MLSTHSVPRQAVLIIVGIIGSLTITAIFLITFGRAQQDVSATGVNMTEAQCQGKCQELIAQGFNYKTCTEYSNNKDVIAYNQSCTINCKVVIKDAIVCNI